MEDLEALIDYASTTDNWWLQRRLSKVKDELEKYKKHYENHLKTIL